MGQLCRNWCRIGAGIEELRERHLKAASCPRDIDVYPPQNAFSQEDEFGRDADVNEARPLALPVRRDPPSCKPVRPSRAPRFRPGADEFGDEAMDEQAFERDPAQVRRAPRRLTSREQYRRIPTELRQGKRHGRHQLGGRGGEESTARQMAQRALQRSQQAARQAATQARNAARSFARNLSQRLGSGYQRVPTSEVELEEQADTAIETDADANVDSAEAAEASAETAFEDVSPTGEAADTAAGLDEISAEEAAQITGDETLADGGEVLADSLGVDAAMQVQSMPRWMRVRRWLQICRGCSEYRVDRCWVDVAAIAGTDAAVDGAAAGTGALTGAFNPGTDIADVFTFGLASAVGAVVGAGLEQGGAAISSANKPKSPKPGISVLPSNDVSSALKKLRRSPPRMRH